MNNLRDELNLSLRVSRFNDILSETVHVGKIKPSKKSKPWMTLHVRVKVSTQNRLRQTIHIKEWICP